MLVGIIVSFAVLVAAIIIARRPATPAGAVVPVPPMGLLNPGGGWISPIDGDEAAKRGCRIVAVATPNYSFHKVEPGLRVTVGQVDNRIDFTEGARRLRGSARGDIVSMGP